MRADLLLFVVDHDLIRGQYTPLLELARLGKRSILVLNKKDLFPPDDLAQILAKLRQRVAGVIDPGYRGEIKVVLTNLAAEAHTIYSGDRIAQLRVVQRLAATFEEVQTLDETPRNVLGFGSTGR